jgi:hypothetical protein
MSSYFINNKTKIWRHIEMKKILIVALLMVLGASLLFADSLTGRDIVEEGIFTTLQGNLISEGTEWYLKTEQGTYQLHFGNRNYLSSIGIELADGVHCTIDGIVSDKDVAVAEATLEGKIYSFRDENGTPLWAGEGNRRNINGYSEKHGSGDGSGQGNGQSSRNGRG